MLLLTSGEMRDYLQITIHDIVLRELRGIATSSITKGEEGKTDRGVMKLWYREPLAHGGFLVKYRADFRDDTFSDVLVDWLEKHGRYSR